MASQTASAICADIFEKVVSTTGGHAFVEQLNQGKGFSCSSVSVGAQPFLAVLLHHLVPQKRVVLVSAGVKLQESFGQDLETWLKNETKTRSAEGSRCNLENPAPQPASNLLYYPSWEVLPHDGKLLHSDIISERLETLLGLTESASRSSLVVTNITALMQRTFSPADFNSRLRVCRAGDRVDPLDLVEWMEKQGYEPEAQVTQKGEIALRGGILDVFPPSSPWPVRLEFFGDEIESIRQFDPLSQISMEVMTEVILAPGGEMGILKQMVKCREPSETIDTTGVPTLLDHLVSGDVVILCEPEALDQQVQEYTQRVPERDPHFVPWRAVLKKAEDNGIVFIRCREERRDANDIDMGLGSLDPFRPMLERGSDLQIADVQRQEFLGLLHRWMRQGYAVHMFCNNEGEQERFFEIWEESGSTSAFGKSAKSENVLERKAKSRSGFFPFSHIGALTRGFLNQEAKVVIVTDAEVFGRYKIQRPRRLKRPHAPSSRSLLDIDFSELEEGDYVVHLQHGIGRYLGLTFLPTGGGMKPLEKAVHPSSEAQECLVLEYAPSAADQPSAKLYVPVSESYLVSKYVGAGKARPQLHALGGKRWSKSKEQAEMAVRDLASELLSIQASRSALSGHGFNADTTWQREFESAFLYEETPDQMRAILETKRDLESSKPMDRLICGDVGYGKTEVAIRAAFKAVMGGKQVAVLVPTTVLAQQHYNTFRERMADYPIRVEILSRFRTDAQQKKVLQSLAQGSVDIVIGTHRVVQKDVAFKDLGLVVVDEEQRFGVLQKEKLKQMRRLVDVLTLSATPIPRTLYLALTGARDMSTIETPPQDRLPVETIVSEYDERIIRDAIERELNREGQVFFLHNRIFDIQTVADQIKNLVPRARVAVGHGQMHADDLEQVMTQFVNGEVDVLLSTTIIESGIDIPNANTIIIDRADRFGLSDLYQLRGRVGRYKHQAYAYLLIPRHARMLTDARKRISAIKQYSTLGSGFKIAMRDLEIRGAGNLLGPQQSGHITAVGFDLYCQLLKQSVSALKGEKVRPRIDTVLKLDFLALHPGRDSAVPSQDQSSPMRRADKPSPRRRIASVDDTKKESSDVESDNRLKSFASGTSEADRAFAFIPYSYVSDARQRIGVYRKLAEATTPEDVQQIHDELRDRFGPLPGAAELLMRVTNLRLLAAAKGLASVETRGDKLMLTRNQEFVTVDGRFPRLAKRGISAKLKEIETLLRVM